MKLPLALDLMNANACLPASKSLIIRQATADDLPYISTIEQLTSVNPWSNRQLNNCLEQSLVLIQEEQLIGFAVVILVEDQAELHNIAINPQVQGQGLGRFFLQALIEALPVKIKQLYLEVRVSNYRAIRLYHRMGFSKIAERKDYYRNGLGREDAVIMARNCAT